MLWLDRLPVRCLLGVEDMLELLEATPESLSEPRRIVRNPLVTTGTHPGPHKLGASAQAPLLAHLAR